MLKTQMSCKAPPAGERPPESTTVSQLDAVGGTRQAAALKREDQGASPQYRHSPATQHQTSRQLGALEEPARPAKTMTLAPDSATAQSPRRAPQGAFSRRVP